MLSKSSSLHLFHRAHVHMPRPPPIIKHRKHKHSNENRRRPIKSSRSNGEFLGEKRPKEGPNTERHSRRIARNPTPTPKRELRRRQRLRRVDPAIEHRADGHGVAHQQGHRAERSDGVERHGAADVDEAEEAADHAGELAGVDGDVFARVHGAEPR